MKLVAVAVACLLLSACGGSSGPPDVDWSQVPQNQRQAIDAAVSAKNCQQMQTYFDGSKASDVLTYLDWQMKHAGCY